MVTALLASACVRPPGPVWPPVAETRTTAAPVGADEALRRTCDLPDEPREAAKFDHDSARISEPDEEILVRVADCYMAGHLGDATIAIVGFTDPRGSEEYNRQLGLYRAIAARMLLEDLGVPASAIVVESRGEQAAAGADEQGWAVDRRVEIRLGPRP